MDSSRAWNVLFIPSRIENTLAQLENDPGYARRVLNVIPEWERKQWRDGNWDAIVGADFEVNPAQIRERDITLLGVLVWGRRLGPG